MVASTNSFLTKSAKYSDIANAVYPDMVTRYRLPSGLIMITAKAGGGKSILVDSGLLTFSNTKDRKSEMHLMQPLNEHYKGLFKLIKISTTNEEILGEVDKIVGNIKSNIESGKVYTLANFYEDVDFLFGSEDGSFFDDQTCHVFTEQLESNPPSEGWVVVPVIDFDAGNKLQWEVRKNGGTGVFVNIMDLIFLLSIIGPTFVKSASPTFFTLPDLPNVTLKRGLSALYLDSAAVLNAQLTMMGSTVVFEVRDDFEDDEHKLNGAPRLYINLHNISIGSLRYRSHPYDDYCRNTFDLEIKNLHEILRHLRQVVAVNKSSIDNGSFVINFSPETGIEDYMKKDKQHMSMNVANTTDVGLKLGKRDLVGESTLNT